MDNNTESLLTSLITSSQPSLNSETTIESFVNTKETPNSRKRPSPDSPQDLVATLKQETKQTRRRNSNSRKMQIRNHDDIMDILRRLDTGVDRIFEDHGSVESVINPN